MGQKVSFNSITRIIAITTAPDANGDITINVKRDLYSDGKEDWVANENLRKVSFPITAMGGNPLPGELYLGSTFFLDSNWKIQPYSADHRLIIDGNLYSKDGSDPFLDTNGYTVRVVQQVSSLTNTISAGSGVTEQDKDDIINGVWTQSDNGNLVLKILRNKREIKKVDSVWHLIVYDNDNVTPVLDKVLKDVNADEIADLADGILAKEMKSSV